MNNFLMKNQQAYANKNSNNYLQRNKQTRGIIFNYAQVLRFI